MSRRIGLALAHDAVRAVLVRRGRVAWVGEAGRAPGTALATTIESVLAAAPRRPWHRLPVVAAVGPHAAQAKRLEGLPPVEDPDVLAAVVRESAGAFFLRNGVPLTTTGVRLVEPGTAWAGAIEAPVFEAIRDGCAAAGARLVAVVPSAVALPLGVAEERFTWVDGPVALRVEHAAGRLMEARRIPAALSDAGSPPPTAVAALARLDDRGILFADAFGAALLVGDEALSIGPRGVPSPGRARFAAAIRLPLAITGLALAAFVASPVPAEWTAGRAEARLRALHASEAWEAMEAATRDVAPVTAALNEIDAFARADAPVGPVLADLARSLPDGAALMSARVRGGEGELVVVAADAESVLAALRASPGLRAIELLDQEPGRVPAAPALERLAIRFRAHEPPHDGSAVENEP
jgi:hypothetical protein